MPSASGVQSVGAPGVPGSVVSSSPTMRDPGAPVASSVCHRTLEDPMQTSRFQLGLIAVLAGGLGHALSSTTADAYPAGAAISTGTNPFQSVAGRINLGSVTTVDDVIGAGSDHDLVLTDIVISLRPVASEGGFSIDVKHDCYAQVTLVRSGIKKMRPSMIVGTKRGVGEPTCQVGAGQIHTRRAGVRS